MYFPLNTTARLSQNVQITKIGAGPGVLPRFHLKGNIKGSGENVTMTVQEKVRNAIYRW